MKALLAVMLLVAASHPASPSVVLRIVGPAERLAPGVASTQYDEIRLTLSPDGKTALWFSRNRPGGPGGYDIWVSRNDGQRWRPAMPVPFNSPGRDFDPAFPPMAAWCISVRIAQAAWAATICTGSAWGATVDSGSRSILARQ